MIKISGFKKADAGQVIAYNAIKNEKTKFGTFKKTYFHIHTPESYDYYFLNDWKKSGLKKHTETEVFNYCLDNKIITPNAVFEEIELDEKYKSKKEMLAFLALAQSLIEKSAEIVVVSDHNTIAGFEKLYHAFELLKGYKANITPPKLVLGIEISCADLLHVVGIFERNDSVISLLNQWLKENLINVESGSYKTSLDVLQFIQSLEGIGYIAHISSENIFKENSLNKAYKEKLFNDNCLKAVGVKNKEQVKTVKNMLTQYRSTDISFVIDTDSHCVDDIEEQYFWIKGSKAGFTAIKEAIIDYDISIAFENNVTTEQYIEGIYITYNDKGFLSGKGDKKPFCLSFSNSLNCLIGGRGTGKSTVLEMLEYILSQRYDSYHLLEFICNHGYSYVLYMYEGTEYFIEMRMPYKKDEHDKVSKIILQSRTRRYYSERFQGKELEIKKCLINNYLKIYRIKQTDETLQVEIVSNRADFLKKFFDTRHSINDLVNSTSEANINEFIYNTLFKNKTLSDPRKGINFKKFSGLKKAILKIEEIFNDREKEVKSVIEPFNETQKGTLKIGYNQILGMTSPPYEKLLFGSNFKERVYYKSFNITEQNIVEYLDALFMEFGMFEFFKMIVDKDVSKALKAVDIIDFCSTMTERLIDDGIKEINRENAHQILDSVFYDFLNEDNVNLIKEYFQDAVFDAESFSLKFNINNKENATGKPIFKNVDELSLGQKVVAMLSFILGYSEYSKDYRPLLLDQPEDNLDNQYIYKNLVAELRKVKDKRQVIIATHNATIVTNAKADQVCVMESDNEHGWISITGYPGERKIKEKIINYLEGGKESFKHKISIYDEVLK